MEREFWKPGNMLYPVPAVMISCKRPDERPNIITVAWAGTICSDPAMVSISVRKERYSYEIIKETSVNLNAEAAASGLSAMLKINSKVKFYIYYKK